MVCVLNALGIRPPYGVCNTGLYFHRKRIGSDM
jgi:hypothetical protein